MIMKLKREAYQIFNGGYLWIERKKMLYNLFLMSYVKLCFTLRVNTIKCLNKIQGNLILVFLIPLVGAGAMAQWVRALAGLPEDLGSNPSTYMVVHSRL